MTSDSTAEGTGRLGSDPFHSLNRKARWQARYQRWRRWWSRPFAPARIAPDRSGPANLLLVGVDTLRADHLGCYGGAQPTSPHLDRLAAAGTLFGDVTAPAPWTLPSFSSALCGVMPGAHGAFLPGAVRNMDTQPPGLLRPDTLTLARHLESQGYRTAAFYSNPFFAFGLAESFGEHHFANLPAGDLLDMAAHWISRHADGPFFCFVLLNDPHEPTTPPLEDLAPFLGSDAVDGPTLAAYARWGRPPGIDLGRTANLPAPQVDKALSTKLAIYDGTIRYVDRCLGAMQTQLAAWDLARSTLVSVFADHGEEFLDHVEFSRAWGHDPRGIEGIGHGHSLFQELLQVPWFSWGPGVPPGVRSREPVSLMDLPATLCDWLGVKAFVPTLPASGFARHLQGRSLAGEQDEADRLILAEAIAYGPDLVAVRRGRWKLMAHRDGRPLALFDLLGSPGEERDLAAANPSVVAELQDLLRRWRESGCVAATDEGGPDSWNDMEDTVRQRLKDLGYSD